MLANISELTTGGKSAKVKMERHGLETGRAERKTLSIQEKIHILKAVDAHAGKRTTLAKTLSMPVSTLNTIIKNRKVIERHANQYGSMADKRKHVKTCKYQKMENILKEWFFSKKSVNIPINGVMIRDKALYIANELGMEDFTASNGWIDRFKKRHNVVYKISSNEKNINNSSLKDDNTYDPNTEIDGNATGNSNKICRLCLRDHATIFIFKDYSLLQNILNCCTLQVIENDGLPDHICLKCADIIQAFSQFKKECLDNNNILKNTLNASYFEFMRTDCGSTLMDEEHVERGKLDNFTEALNENRNPLAFVNEQYDLYPTEQYNSIETNQSFEIEEKIEKNSNEDDNNRYVNYCEDSIEMLETKYSFEINEHEPERGKMDNDAENIDGNNRTNIPSVQLKNVPKQKMKSGSEISEREINTDDIQVKLKCKMCNTKKEKYKCTFCSKIFFSRQNLFTHKILHNKRIANCRKCKNAFNHINNMKVHIRHLLTNVAYIQKCVLKHH